MKTTPLWKDPIGWSEKIAKTPSRVCIWIVSLVVVIFFALIFIHLIASALDKVGVNRLSAILVGGPLIICFGVIYPAMYLYAIYRLLAIIREKEKNALPVQVADVAKEAAES